MADVTNYTIENASGANVRSDLNSVLGAIQSSNSKSSDLATSQCVAGMPFLNTTTNILKIRNSSNNGFTEIGNINTPNLGLLSASGGTMTGVLALSNGSNSAPSVHVGDSTTGLFKTGTNQIGFTAAGTETLFLDHTGLTVKQQADIRFNDSDNSNYIAFQAPATVPSNIIFTLPATDAAVSGYALVSNANGVLSWASSGAGATGGGTDNIFWENDQTVTQNYTITNGQNAGSFGPITIQSGVTVTVGTGETWTVV